MKVSNTTPGAYVLPVSQEDTVIAHALTILRSRLAKPGAILESPQAVRDYLRLELAAEQSEVFACLWLDSKHRVLNLQRLFQGTIDSAQVYPRVVVKAALTNNAAAVVLVHNHPSGGAEPSQSDLTLTARLKEALALIDVRTLDHMIVGGCAGLNMYSFAENGRL